MSFQELKNGINLLNKIVNELRNNEYPNDWKLISSSEMIINDKKITFCKQLKKYNSLYELISKYMKMGFSTEKWRNSCLDKKTLADEISDSAQFWDVKNFPLIHLDTINGLVKIYCFNPSEDSSHNIDDYANIRIEIPVELKEITKYLL